MLLKRSILKSAGVLALCLSVFAFGFSAEMPVRAEGTGEIQQSVIFAGGRGTAENPYRIETAEQLGRIREHLTDHYILMKDIDLSGYENWEPIGRFELVRERRLLWNIKWHPTLKKQKNILQCQEKAKSH